MSQKIVGDRIREARKRREMKQVDLAQSTGLQPSAISQFETGRREPSPDNLGKLASALGVTTDYLLGRDDLVPSGPQLQIVFQQAQKMTYKNLDLLARFSKFLNHNEQKPYG